MADAFTHRHSGEYSRIEDNDIPVEYGEEWGTETAVHLASLQEKKRIWWREAVINLLFIASWFFFATILSLYNKWMFSPEYFGFPWPIFVTAFHMVVQFILAAIVRNIWPKKFKPSHSPSWSDYGFKTAPAAVTTALDIGLGNQSLKTITLSFYTMCKSSSLFFVLLFAFIFGLEAFSWRLVGVIFLIVGGVLLMVATQTHFVLLGFILVLIASALGGLRWSLTQLLLKDKKAGMSNPIAAMYWMTPLMGLALALITVTFYDVTQIFSSRYFMGVGNTLYTSLFLLLPGIVAFCMVLSEYYIIQRAGVVPMSIAGIAKEVTTITISAWFFGDELTPLNITGVAITVCGIALYTYHKYQKSIDSTIPVDGQGKPILSMDELIDGDEHHVELSDTELLTSPTNEGSSLPLRTSLHVEDLGVA